MTDDCLINHGFKSPLISLDNMPALITHDSPCNLTLVIVMKSGPRNTPLTPSTLNSCLARGDRLVDIGLGKSMVCPVDRTGTPGINLSDKGLGVS